MIQCCTLYHMHMPAHLLHFSSAGCAFHMLVSWANAVCVDVDVWICVWMLTRVEQIVSAVHRDL